MRRSEKRASSRRTQCSRNWEGLTLELKKPTWRGDEAEVAVFYGVLAK